MCAAATQRAISRRSVGSTNISVRDGDLTGAVTAQDGWIKLIQITNGNLDNTASTPLVAGAGIGRVSVQGNFVGMLDSGAGLDQMDVNGTMLGVIEADYNIKKVTLGEVLNGTIIRSGGSIDSLTAASLTGTTVSSAWGINKIAVGGNVADSSFYAGYDLGRDLLLGSADDNPIAGGVHSGIMGSIDVGGNFTNSHVYAGIDPSDDSEAPGVSRVDRVNIRGTASGSTIAADTYVDSKFAKAGVTVTAEVTGATTGTGTQFGQGSDYTNGQLTISLHGAGLGWYDAGTSTIFLSGTGAGSSLSIANTGTSRTINIDSADDSGLGGLTTSGAVMAGQVDIDGHVASVQASGVANNSQWNLLGGVDRVTLASATSNLAVKAGAVGDWRQAGSYTGGGVTADSVKSFTLSAGDMSGDFDAILGTTGKVSVAGELSGHVTSRGPVSQVAANAFSGTISVENGDLTTLGVENDFTGEADILRGGAKMVEVRSGEFAGTFTSRGDVNSFAVRANDFTGEATIGGAVSTFSVGGSYAGQATVGGNVKTVSFGTMDGGKFASLDNIGTVRINGDMTTSSIYSGYDPNGWSGDGQGLSGSISSVDIRGDMAQSTIAAAVDPGADGYVGTLDDKVGGMGTVGRVRVMGAMTGNNAASQSYGVFAASNVPDVRVSGNQPFVPTQNVKVERVLSSPALLRVEAVQMQANQVTVKLNKAPDVSTLTNANITLMANGVDLIADGTVVIGSFDETGNILTISVADGTAWNDLGLGSTFTLAMSDNVTDNRMQKLDGERVDFIPSGNDLAGGDFQWTFGHVVLDAPVYDTWYNGCTPTATSMVLAYWDARGYGNLLPGDASTQTQAVEDATASPEHIADYALYDGVDDSEDAETTTDLSELGGAHASNSIADFLKTSWSAEGVAYGFTAHNNITPGIEAYLAYVGYAGQLDVSNSLLYGSGMGWGTFTSEINAGRPVLLSVDSNADGVTDHSVAAIGYDIGSGQYAYANTWDSDVQWSDFTAVQDGVSFGIYSGWTIQAA